MSKKIVPLTKISLLSLSRYCDSKRDAPVPRDSFVHSLSSLIVFQVTLIAQGDVALSIVMTVCTTLGAVLLTPLLTKILAGTYVPVDALKLSISTLQVIPWFLFVHHKILT